MLRKHQRRMLEMLLELDRICRKHDIPYFLYGGTLLGAVRHGGFIPWDDDLDVALMRSDYLRLLKVLPAELPGYLALQTADTDPNYFYLIDKVRDRRTYLQECCAYEEVFRERGVYIDIFPLEEQHFWLHMLSEPLQGHTFKLFRKAKDKNKVMPCIRRITWMNRRVVFPLMRWVSRLTGGHTLTCSYGIPYHKKYRTKDVFPLTTWEFEGHSLPVPGNVDGMLRAMFGDYMRLPDLDRLAPQHVTQLKFYE